jgi:hypothetical protein
VATRRTTVAPEYPPADRHHADERDRPEDHTEVEEVRPHDVGDGDVGGPPERGPGGHGQLRRGGADADHQHPDDGRDAHPCGERGGVLHEHEGAEPGRTDARDDEAEGGGGAGGYRRASRWGHSEDGTRFTSGDDARGPKN